MNEQLVLLDKVAGDMSIDPFEHSRSICFINDGLGVSKPLANDGGYAFNWYYASSELQKLTKRSL